MVGTLRLSLRQLPTSVVAGPPRSPGIDDHFAQRSFRALLVTLFERQSAKWTRASGVLPLDRVLAEEHDRLHGDTVGRQLDALSLSFDTGQVLDAGGLAYALFDALQRLESHEPHLTHEMKASAHTRFDDAAIYILGGDAGAVPPEMRAALIACQEAQASSVVASGYTARAEMADFKVAELLVARLNELLADEYLTDVACFQPFLSDDCIAALGDSRVQGNRLANRLLIEAVFPTQLVKLRDRGLELVYAAARKRETAALCLSGGGIRSATFALGVLRGLAKHKLLGKFDYLSTVSGGGYIGSWLSAWMRHAGARTVHEELSLPGSEKINPEPEPVRHLRAYSHYLTPRVGMMSADTWTLTATMLRNLLLNWFVLIPLMAAVVLIPRFLVALVRVDYHELTYFGADGKNLLLNIVLFVSVLAGVIAVRFVHRHRDREIAGFGKGIELRATQEDFIKWCLFPMVTFAMLQSGLWYVWWDWSAAEPELVRLLWLDPTLGGGSLPSLVYKGADFAEGLQAALGHRRTLFGFLILGLVVHVAGWLWARRSARKWGAEVIPVIVTGLMGGLVLLVVAMWFITRPETPAREMLFVTFAPPALLVVALLGGVLFSGWTSRGSSDSEREWSARFGAWLLIVIVGWVVGSAIVLFGPGLVSATWQQFTLLSVGTVTGIATVVLGRSDKTPDQGKGASSANVAGSAGGASIGGLLRKAALATAAPMFVVIIVTGLAAGNERLVQAGCEFPAFASMLGCRPNFSDSTTVTRAKPLQVLAAYHTARLDSLSTQFGSTGTDAAFNALIRRVVRDSAWNRRSADSVERMLDSVRRVDSRLVRRSALVRDAVLGADSIMLLGSPADAIMRDQLDRRWVSQYIIDSSMSARFDGRDVLMDSTDALLRAVPALQDTAKASAYARVHAAFIARVGAALAVEEVIRADSVKRAASSGAVYQALDAFIGARPRDDAVPLTVLVLFVVLLGIALLMGWRIDTNKFSLHGMYHARLVRAYLGASRPASDRNPNPFTGFDPRDDVPMRDLFPSASAPTLPTAPGLGRSEDAPPLHIVNVALNLLSGHNLAWQQRKAASMTISPLHAGSAFVGYRRTSPAAPGAADNKHLYGSDGPDHAITLGTALTISGAAASPNAGYHSSPIVTFLMTLFNARLGSWLGNPGPAGHATYALSAPKQHLTPILSEMFGLTTDRNPYVNLSDGGHFENLGLYEMVLRRCRFIVVSDAGCDPGCTFEDLGNAVRKIRVDLGVPITFDSDIRIHARGQTMPGANSYWAVGRIWYSAVDKKAEGKEEDFDGVLLYVKPAVYGQEPRDVYNYAQVSATFPHESTTDQFFSESQFESYRALGEHIVDQLVIRRPAETAPPSTIPGHRDGSLLRLWPELTAAMPRGSRRSLIAPNLALSDTGGVRV